MAWKGGHRKHNRLTNEFRAFAESAQKPWNYNVEGKHWDEESLRKYLKELKSQEMNNLTDNSAPLIRVQRRRGRPVGWRKTVVPKVATQTPSAPTAVKPELQKINLLIEKCQQDLTALQKVKEMLLLFKL